jgi:hypothetical protein
MTQHIQTFQTAHQFGTQDLRQGHLGKPPFLQLPLDVLGLIAEFSATGSSPQEAASNAIRFGKVCVFTHLLSHHSKLDSIIDQGELHNASAKLVYAIDKTHAPDYRNELNALCAALRKVTAKLGIKKDSQEFVAYVFKTQRTIQSLSLELDKSPLNSSSELKTKMLSFEIDFFKEIITDLVADTINGIQSEKNLNDKIVCIRSLFSDAKSFRGTPIYGLEHLIDNMMLATTNNMLPKAPTKTTIKRMRKH